MIEPNYSPNDIEQNAQRFWEANKTDQVKEDLTKEKYYCLSMLPYPSGQLHVGHVRNYTIGDVIARYQRMQGKNVLQPMGWDAFGLPAENAAIKHKRPPAKWTYDNIARMREQLKQMGFAIDWSREITTCDPEYYKWEQWLFIQLYRNGLVYREKAYVNWDPVDQTVLSNEQVVNGKGWRSGAPIERRQIQQWFLKITAYADELLDNLAHLDGWPDEVKTMQRHWIGRSYGTQLDFKVKEQDQVLSAFTTRPDTLMGVTYLAIAAEHPLAQQAAQTDPAIAEFIERCSHQQTTEAAMATQEKAGVASPFDAEHPLTGETLPIWIANYVLMDYGDGVVMAVPAHDARDHAFALKYELPIKQVIAPKPGQTLDVRSKAFIDRGYLIHSGQFDGQHSDEAQKAITQTLKNLGAGHGQYHFRLRDWGISRQRYWGTPIPMIHCHQCGTVPVPEHELPVKLPQDLVPDGTTSPLKTHAAFYKTTCPACGEPAKRETDTFDTFMESAWYYARYTCPGQNKAMLDDRANYWTPVDQYIGGIEHAVMHLLYARFMHKVLRDWQLLNSDEPFERLLTQGMVLNNGAKMSKSKGNVVNPDQLLSRYGADTVRLFIVFAAPPEQNLEWSDTGIEGVHRFIKRLWQLAYTEQMTIQSHAHDQWSQVSEAILDHRRAIHQQVKQAGIDMQRQHQNTVAAAAMKIVNTLQSAPKDATGYPSLITEGMNLVLRLLAPITPHVTHHLWQALGFGTDIFQAGWPKADPKALKTDTVTLAVQVNGKRRAEIKVPVDADRSTIESIALGNDNIKRHLNGQSYKKLIVVPQRLVNIVV